MLCKLFQFALGKGWRSIGSVLVLLGGLTCLPPQARALQSVTLAWYPSSDPSVVGYKVHYGCNSGHYPQTVDVGGQTHAIISGLVEGQTYYFVATAYNVLGMESVPSNETAYTVPGFSLLAGPTRNSAAGKTFVLTSTPQAPSGWVLEASTDLKTWKALSVGAHAPASVTVTHSPAPNRFFRLKSDRPGVSLVTRKAGANGFPNSFHLTTAGATPTNWTVEASSDLRNWSPLATGSNSPVNVAVVMSEPPAMFFRLKEQ